MNRTTSAAPSPRGPEPESQRLDYAADFADTVIDVSVIIPARNAAATLPIQLEALAGQDYPDPWEIVVVDNASTDATVSVGQLWQRKIPHLRVMTAPWHPGSGHSRNEGARLATGRWLLFCDADDVVGHGWVSAMVEGLREFDLVGGMIERRRLNSSAALAGRPGTGSDLLDGFRHLPYVSSASMSVRRKIWDRVAGFDERFAAGDDIDVCWRVQMAGGRIGIAPGAIVHYRLRPTLRSTMRQLYRYGRAHARLYHQYAPMGMPPSTRTTYDPVRAWRRIAALTPRALWSRTAASTLCADLAFRAGRLVGSLRHRVCYL